MAIFENNNLPNLHRTFIVKHPATKPCLTRLYTDKTTAVEG